MAKTSVSGWSRSQPPSIAGSTGGSDGIAAALGPHDAVRAGEQRVAESERRLVAQALDRDRGVRRAGGMDHERGQAEPPLVGSLRDVGVLDARAWHADVVPPQPAVLVLQSVVVEPQPGGSVADRRPHLAGEGEGAEDQQRDGAAAD